jgi:MFS family permease
MSLSTTAPPGPAAVRAATTATYAAFAGSGFAFANWASRIPQVRDHLHLDPSTLGLVLLSIAAGSVLALPLSGIVVARIGSSRTVFAMAVLGGVALATTAAGYVAGLPVLVIGLFLLGFAQGAWDVAMNVQGAAVERHLGRSIMPRFHGGWSLGTVAGALVGAVMVALGVHVTVHLAVVAVVVSVIVPLYSRRFLADHEGDDEHESSAEPKPGALAAWKEPRTLLIGVLVLAFAFAEGAGNDWIGVAAIDGYRVPPAVGTLGFAMFLSAMTLGRWFGPALLDRYGRVPVLRAMTVVGVLGVLVFVFTPNAWLAFPGTLLWGVGASLGFPVGMSAGSDEPKRAAARVSVLASIGYCAFLGGPPAIGFLGDHVTVLRALTAVAALFAGAILVSGSVRPLETPRTPRTPGTSGEPRTPEAGD